MPAVILTIVSLVAGHPVKVECDTDRGPRVASGYRLAGWADIPNSTAHLRPEMCELFRERSEWTGVGMHVLLHESFHLRGIVDEAETEACAYTRLPWALHRVGFRGKLLKRAVALGRQYSRNQMPPDYQGGTCPIKGAA